MVYPASFICAEPEILCNAADTYLKTLKDAESAVKVCFRVCQHPTSTLLLICIFYESQLVINPRLIIASHYFSPPFFFSGGRGGWQIKDLFCTWYFLFASLLTGCNQVILSLLLGIIIITTANGARLKISA